VTKVPSSIIELSCNRHNAAWASRWKSAKLPITKPELLIAAPLLKGPSPDTAHGSGVWEGIHHATSVDIEHTIADDDPVAVDAW
jgi:hypothetical protein